MSIVDPLPNVPWYIKLVITALVGGFITLATDRVTSNHNDTISEHKALTARIDTLEQKQTGLEVHQSGDHETLNHIQSQVDKLVEWALGHK